MLNLKIMIMKTLVFFVTMTLLFGLMPNNTNAQKLTEEMTVPFSVYFECMGQELYGELTLEMYIGTGSHRKSKAYGVLTGSVDGLEYEFKLINNISEKGNWDEFGLKGITFTWPGHYHVSLDGKLIAVVHFAFHYTFNALGELVSMHGEAFECNLVGEGRQPSQYE